jgi:exodeoxyribonuclease VII large subunit
MRRRETVNAWRTRLPLLVSRIIDARLSQAKRLHGLLLERLPLRAVTERRLRVSRAVEHILAFAAATLKDRGDRIERAVSLLSALGPFQVLDRGYSICFKEDGTTIITDAATVAASEKMFVRLRRGRLGAEVISRELK